MARENLEEKLKSYAENTIDKIMDNLDSKDAQRLKSSSKYEQKKIEAVADFLNNFYFRLPGGWYHELYEEATENNPEKKEMYERKFKILSEVKNCMLASGLSTDECKELENIPSNLARKYIFENDSNKYRFLPMMLNVYSMMRKKGYSREELIC